MIKKHFKKILLSILVLLIVAFGFTGNYFYNFALNPKVDKSAIVNQDSDGEKEDKTAVENWFESTKTEVTMESVTKNKLVGYKFVNPNAKKWIFVVHGYTSDAKKMAKYIKRFYDMGYSVFAPDLIAHGKSEHPRHSARQGWQVPARSPASLRSDPDCRSRVQDRTAKQRVLRPAGFGRSRSGSHPSQPSSC